MSLRGMCNTLIDRLGRRDLPSSWEFHQERKDVEPLMRRMTAGEWRYRMMTDEERVDWLFSKKIEHVSARAPSPPGRDPCS